MKTLIKVIAWLFIILLAAVVIIPLVVLAGLFVWLKLTEEADEEALELESDLESPTTAPTTGETGITGTV